jgi:N-acetylglucosamine-6-phosphate deacetylase
MKIPGFVDLQVNGYKGIDFSSQQLTEQEVERVCREMIASGTAAFLATMVTCPDDVYKKNLPLIAEVISSPEFAGSVSGIHLEGPFISPQPGVVGAHNSEWVQKPSIDHFKQLQQWAGGKIKLMTVAAEVEGAEALVGYASENGIIVSLGHQLTGAEEMRRCERVGATALTHLGNGMPNLVNRHGGPLLAGLANRELTAMIITDGHHLPESVITAIIECKGVSKIVVVSDISCLAGMPPGRYKSWGGNVVLEKSGLLHDPEKKCLAGSSSTMLECMNYLASLDMLSEEELLEVGFYNPLRLINVESDTIKSDYALVYDKEKRIFEIQK